MQLLKSVVYAALAATSLADGHHAHRREAAPEPALQYVTVYTTFYATADREAPAVPTDLPKTTSDEVSVPPSPWEASATPSQAPAPPAPWEALAPSLTAPAAPVEPLPSSSSAAPSQIAPAAPVEPATGSPSSAAPANTHIPSVGSSGALGVIYSPYTNNGGCKSSEAVKKDLEGLAGYDIIRIYGTDCNQVANVYAGKAPHQKIFAGVFDVFNIENNLEIMHAGLKGDWSAVHTVSIGNELVNNGQASVSDIARYMKTARSKLAALGYTGPVVAVDTFIAVINNPGLCELSDYLAVNAHAYFDGGVTAAQAGPWAEEQIQRVWNTCGSSKKVAIVESGWPSQGPSNGKAVCSEADQKAAVSSLKSTIGNDLFLFTAYNDLWKTPGVEQWWGIYGTSQNQ